MRLVILESPYAAPTPEGVAENVRYARACVRDCLQRGESPVVSHLLFTQPGILDDAVPEERALGIEAGLAWGRHAELTVVYTDRGISRGMQQGIERAYAEVRPVEMRTLPGWIDRDAPATIPSPPASDPLALAAGSFDSAAGHGATNGRD